jgi:hypothetical protein
MRPATKVHEWWERWGRVDPLTAAVGAVALITYALHGFDGYLSRDLGVYSYAGQQVADGVPPYLGILNRAGPLAHLIPAIGVAGARVGGFDELLGMRLLFLVISVACVCLVYLLGRDLFASRLAGLAAAGAFLSFSGFIEYASNGPREKTAMVLFLLCALLAVQKRRWFVAGLSVSLATLVLQPAFFVGLPAMLVAVIGVQHGERIRALVRIAVGGLVPVAIFLLYFAAVGALREFIDDFALINAKYSAGSSNPVTPSNFANVWSRLEAGYGVSLWVMVLGLGALGLLSLSVLRGENRRKDPGVITVTAFGVATLVGLAWTSRDFDSWPDAFLFLPLAAIGYGGLVRTIIDRLSSRVAVALTLTWVVAAVAVAGTYSLADRDHRLTYQRRSVDAMLARLPSDATFLSINAPQALVLSGKTNPTIHQVFAGGLADYVDDTWPGGIRGFGDRIGREQPTVIAIGGNWPPWLAETIKTGYRRAGKAPGWFWYVNRSVAPEVPAARH